VRLSAAVHVAGGVVVFVRAAAHHLEHQVAAATEVASHEYNQTVANHLCISGWRCLTVRINEGMWVRLLG